MVGTRRIRLGSCLSLRLLCVSDGAHASCASAARPSRGSGRILYRNSLHSSWRASQARATFRHRRNLVLGAPFRSVADTLNRRPTQRADIRLSLAVGVHPARRSVSAPDPWQACSSSTPLKSSMNCRRDPIRRGPGCEHAVRALARREEPSTPVTRRHYMHDDRKHPRVMAIGRATSRLIALTLVLSQTASAAVADSGRSWSFETGG